jgi:chorismate synthase
MGGSSFGDLFKIVTFGSSHGEAIGVVIEGCPSGLGFDELFIQKALDERRPGSSPYVSPRNELDRFKLLSGVYQGYTTGDPITLVIENRNSDSAPYEPLATLYRPGHANFTYLEKYGLFDPRGGGRASARETAARVAAGAVAQLVLKEYGIELEAYLTQIGPFKAEHWDQSESLIFCPDSEVEKQMMVYLEQLALKGDSIGGIVTGIIRHVPVGLGEPIFDRFEAQLAHAMLSIPATKGFEIGEGFQSAFLHGSQFNDQFYLEGDKVAFKSNHAGGTLGGISNGDTINFRTVFKPASSIKLPQKTLSLDRTPVEFSLDQKAKHDPCVAIRGTPVVKAMAALVTCDLLLKTRLNRLSSCNLLSKSSLMPL